MAPASGTAELQLEDTEQDWELDWLALSVVVYTGRCAKTKATDGQELQALSEQERSSRAKEGYLTVPRPDRAYSTKCQHLRPHLSAPVLADRTAAIASCLLWSEESKPRRQRL